MKKIVSSIIAANLLLAQGLYSKKEEVIDLNKNLILKTTTQQQTNSLSINNNQFLVGDSSKIKIFNINTRELQKTIPGEDLIQSKISSDGTKIIALSKKQLFIVDAKSYKILSTIKKDFSNFIEQNNILITMQTRYNGKIIAYNLNTGKTIFSITANHIKSGVISPNMKKIALYSNDNISIYDFKGNLLNTIKPERSYITEIRWANNFTIIVNSNHRQIFEYDVITSNKLANTPDTYYKYDRFEVINPDIILILNDNKAYTYNLKTNKKIQQFTLPQNNDIKNSILTNNYLAISYYKDNYLYNLNLKPKTTTKKSTSPVKVIEKPVVVEKIVEKKVYVKEHKNIKPTVDIFASQTEGIVPLKVNFKIIANDEDGKIVSYYINLAGKEAIGKGNPNKSFSYTFTHPGKYKVMVAVKDNKGAIATKTIIIKTREESFEDYKKGLMGN